MGEEVRCPRCGSGNVIGVAGEWECFNCGYKFKISEAVRRPMPRPPAAARPAAARVRRPVERRGIGRKGSVVLFIVGFFCALLVFPIAFSVSTFLGYLLGVFALIIAVLLIARRGGATLPLVLGLVLVIFSFLSLGGTAMVHMGAYAVSKSLESVTKTETVEAGIGSPNRAGDWEITALKVTEATYIRSGSSYYGAENGSKLILIYLRIRNLGKEVKESSEIWQFTLITDKNKSYDRIYPLGLKLIFKPSEEVKAKAIEYKDLGLSKSIAPNTGIEGHILFQIPIQENPRELYFKVGIIGATQARITL